VAGREEVPEKAEVGCWIGAAQVNPVDDAAQSAVPTRSWRMRKSPWQTVRRRAEGRCSASSSSADGRGRLPESEVLDLCEGGAGLRDS
jgi:hypothetical protein